MNKRIDTIDIAKGIAICAIVIGHVSTGFLWDTCLIFATAAFFLLSGLTFYFDKEENGIGWRKGSSPVDFIKKTAGRLLFPYAVWGIISIIIYMILGKIAVGMLGLENESVGLLQNLLGLLYGNSASGYFDWNRPLWFLPCLFIVELICYFILRITEKNQTLQISAAVLTVLLSLGWLYFLSLHESETFVWFFETETALAMVSFFMIGVLIRKFYIAQAEKKLPTAARIIMAVIGVICIVVVMYTVSKRGGADTRTDLYRGFGWYLMGAWLGIIMVLLVSLAATGLKPLAFLSYVGKRTLPILVMHKFPILLFRILIPSMRAMLDNGDILIELLFGIFIIVLSLVFERIISKYIPILFGIKFSKQKN